MISLPHKDYPIVTSSGVPTQEMYGWMLNVTDAIDALREAVAAQEFLSGNGSPEGVIEANPLKIYIDLTGGDVYYKTGTGNTGWVMI